MNIRTRILTGRASRPDTSAVQSADRADIDIGMELLRQLDTIAPPPPELDDWGYTEAYLRDVHRYRDRMATFNNIYGRDMSSLVGRSLESSSGILNTISTFTQSIFRRML